MTDTKSDIKIYFSPPVFQQRYSRILDLVRDFNPKKVVDFGCAECRFIRLLRNENVEEIFGVDIDGSLLERHVESIRPLAAEYLRPRLTPLVMRLFEGSLSEYDSRLKGVDMITMIEVIEHLLPQVLDEFPQVMFGKLQPKIIVITTPNADFNVLFKRLKHGNFRHWDHKFEWTRDQFEDWCEKVSKKYKYSVSYSGIGQGPVTTEKYGCCSQMAVFIKKHPVSEENVIAKQHPYNQIEEWVFPHINDDKIKREKVLSLVKEFIRDAAVTYKLKIHNREIWPCHVFGSNTNGHKGVMKYAPPTNGQFDDANTDQPTTSDQGKIISSAKPQLCGYKYRRNGYIKHLQNKYFNGRVDAVCVGQFENAHEQSTTKNEMNCTFSYINNSVLHVPNTFLMTVVRSENLKLSYKEVVKIINEHSEEWDVGGTFNEEFIIIDLNNKHFIDSENSSDTDFDMYAGNLSDSDHSSLGQTNEDFYSENWELA